MSQQNDDKNSISDVEMHYLLNDKKAIKALDEDKKKQLERVLLKRLKEEGMQGKTIEPLVVFYSSLGQEETVNHYLNEWYEYEKDGKQIAICLLQLGMHSERINNFEDAIQFYRKGLTYELEFPDALYFLNNNLAFCLNRQGDYKEAMDHALKAIAIDNTRSNAYKNYGISLKELGYYGDSAKIWIKASQVNPGDARSYKLLEELMCSQRQTILADIPDIDNQMKDCYKQIELYMG